MARFCIGLVMALLVQIPPSQRQGIAGYQAAIQSGKIESAFDMLRSLGESLPKVLESLSDSEFQQLQREMPGAIVNREEVVFVEPDVNFFVKLAASRGDAVDRRFFGAFKMTYPESVWPAYVEQQTDYSGCTLFGSAKLIETYRVWSAFQTAFPNRYRTAARAELDRVSHEFIDSTCACGDTAAIQRELEQFVQTFPTSPIRAGVEDRLKRLKAGTSDIHARCISG